LHLQIINYFIVAVVLILGRYKFIYLIRTAKIMLRHWHAVQ